MTRRFGHTPGQQPHTTAKAESPFIRPDEIGRVVLVKTSAWLLSSNEAPSFPTADTPARTADTGRLPVRRLLDTITAPDRPGRAWLCDMGRAAVPTYLSSGDEQARLIEDIDDRVTGVWLQPRRLPQLGRPPLAGRRPAAPPWERAPDELRHRAFLDSARFEALLGSDRSAPLTDSHLRYYVVLELRFFHLLGQLRCHVSMSIWSAVPRHPGHRPDELADDTPQQLAADVGTYQELFDRVAAAAETLLADHGFVRADGSVGDGAQGLPVFWVVLPDDRCLDPMDYLTDSSKLHRTTNHLARTFLNVGDVRDCVVAHSVLNGQLLTLRRPEVREDGLPVPRYLMIPGGPQHLYDDSPEVLEMTIATAITTLTDLEAASASRLLAAKFDLEIWRNHLEVYNAVVERAAFLWDALSTHLPIRRGYKLGRAHRAVELLHQMLLQGVADLGHITTLIRQDTAKVVEVADDVWDQYNATITERSTARQAGLAAALTETGLSAHVRREAGEIADEAGRVKTAYEDLLGAIAHAFDERRVREFDVLQKFNFLLGAALGAVGLVTVLDATVQMKPPDGGPLTLFGGAGWWGELSVVTSWILGVLLVGVGTVVLSRTTLIGRLGSPRFRAIYDGRAIRRRLGHRLPWDDPPWGVWQVLRNISTDTLERLAKRVDAGAAEYPAAYGMAISAPPPAGWNEIDNRLADEYAAIWDEIARLPRPRRDHRAGRDIKALSEQIEQWGMHALLLTERPRRMYRYPLPVLTCLFRATERVGGSFLGATHLSRTNMVAYEDLTRSLARVGFTGDEVRLIDAWLTTTEFASAADALSRIRRLGLRDRMTGSAREEALALLRSRP